VPLTPLLAAAQPAAPPRPRHPHRVRALALILALSLLSTPHPSTRQGRTRELEDLLDRKTAQLIHVQRLALEKGAELSVPMSPAPTPRAAWAAPAAAEAEAAEAAAEAERVAAVERAAAVEREAALQASRMPCTLALPSHTAHRAAL